MSFLIQKELKEMLTNSTETCLSLYMPVIAPGKGDEENKIRYKNLLQKSEAALIDAGINKSEAESFLKDARQFLEDPVFFKNHEKGFVLFINKQSNSYFFLPYEVPEIFTVGDHFFIKPLLPSFYGDGQYFILGISKEDARLFSASKRNIFEIDITEIVKEANRQMDMVETEKSLDHHSVSSASGGPGAIFHGKEDTAFEKDMIKQFFRLIEDGLSEILKKHNYPLVLVGVDYLLPIYQEINKYHHIISKGIHGNPDDFTAESLHEKTWSLVEDLFLKDLQADLETYNQKKGTGETSMDIDEIVTTSSYGQIASLFITMPNKNEGDPSDPLNIAAINTIKNSGKVYGVSEIDLDPGVAVAALYRY